MTDKPDGAEILRAFQQMRDLCEDVVLLLKTADTFMHKDGWQDYSGNTAVAQTSGSLTSPRWWVPWGAFRFYTHPERKHLVAYVCVLFDHPDKSESMTEPLVIAGLLDWREAGEVGNWDYGYARWHIGPPGRKDDGTVVVTNPKEVWPSKNYTLTRMLTVALPLVEVTNADILNARILEPVFGPLASATAGDAE